MPYAKNGETDIYYEVEGKGHPLVMLHGFTSSLESYKEAGFVDALKDDFQIILMDARGHGKSDKPHLSESYGSDRMIGDVLAVADTLGIGQFIFFGYSFGGGIAYELALAVPERVSALIIGGAGPEKPPPQVYRNIINSLKSAKKALSSKIDAGQKASPGELRFLGNDFEALEACSKAIGTGQINISALSDTDIPFFLFAGENDPAYNGIKEFSTRLRNAKLLTLPGLDHVQAGSRPDLVVPHIREFLGQVID